MMGHKKCFMEKFGYYPYIISVTPSYREGALIFKVNAECNLMVQFKATERRMHW